MKIEPSVELINATADALTVLVFTKSGRLKPGATFEDVKNMSETEKLDHLQYMLDTIQTSFEFVDYVFHIKNVSRAFTHQIVRTRTASFQQQSQRAVDARDFNYLVSCDDPLYTSAAESCKSAYGELIDKGVPVQDARGVLPVAIHTEIIIKANLRTLSNMAELRLCKRVQGEYQQVFKLIVKEILAIHPWAEPLLEVYCVKNGRCAFPRYDGCPVQKVVPKLDPLHKFRIREAWVNCSHEANPVANKDGMTM